MATYGTSTNTMYWTNTKKSLEGNPTANIPGLKALVEGIGKGFLPCGKIMTATGDTIITEDTIALYTTASGASTVTVAQAANAPGKILFIFNDGNNTVTVQDDAGTPNQVASIASKKAAILICDGSSWLHIPIVTTTS